MKKNEILDELVKRYPELESVKKEIVQTEELLESCFASGGKLLICGNGGSASDAEHIVGELMKEFRSRRPLPFRRRLRLDALDAGGCLGTQLRSALPAIALDAHSALSTAMINDCDPSVLFAQQVLGYGRSGDCLLAMSTSGNSENVLKAVLTAKAMEMKTILLTGAKKGKIQSFCDVVVPIPETETHLVQELTLPIYHAVCAMLEAHFWGDAFEIRIIDPGMRKKREIRCAVFDFDGTVSLIRQGWQEIMIPYFCEVLEETGTGEDRAQLQKIVEDFVTDLTGKQTVFQCIALAEEVTRRGAAPLDPMDYKAEYLRRLKERISSRKEALANGKARPEEWLVPGVRDFLAQLRAKGIRLYLASGTDEEDVRQEAKLLGVDTFFDGGIFGARDELIRGKTKEQITDIKAAVIQDILEKDRIRPEELIGFGDGCVEIELIARTGALAIGAATEEEKRKGINPWKQERLIQAGAAAILSDFSHPEEVMDMIEYFEK